LPSDLPAAIEVEHIARRHGIGVYSLHSGAAHCIGAVPCVERGLIFGYTALPERMIAKGIARLAEALGAQNARRALIATPSLANNAYPAGTPGDAASGSSTSPRGV
jgi:GntR family transcriptional regulator/MocR family aminotransferase